MKKNLLASILFLITISSFAVEDVDKSAFAKTGFEITVSNETEIGLSHTNGVEMILSKKSFDNEQEAINFCNARNSKLDTNFYVLAIALSGAATHSEALAKHISFEIPEADTSGLIAWSGSGMNRVLLLYDGDGTKIYNAPFKEVSTAFNQITKQSVGRFKVPATCIAKNLRPNSTSF